MIVHEVPASVRREELSVYLRRAWPLLPGHVQRDLLKRKDVRINGIRSGKGSEVHGGDHLDIYADVKYFEPETTVLFDDGRLIAAVKPQGLPSLPDRDGVGADTMETRLKRIHPEARLCHRLDSATGGVMLAAVTDDVYDAAFLAFKDHAFHKYYHAILTQRPPKDRMTLKAYLVKDAKHAEVKVTATPGKNAKEIITRMNVLGDAGDGFVHVQLEPVTGRTHQLRAHMAFIGCPILGDDKYGDRQINKKAGFAGKLCLWCETMEMLRETPLKEYAGERFHADPPNWR